MTRQQRSVRIYIIFLFLGIYSCQNIDRKVNCNPPFMGSTSDSFKVINGVCFYPYNIISTIDTIKCYLGVEEDTVRLINVKFAGYEKPFKISFLPLKAEGKSSYGYLDETQYNNILLPSCYVEVTVDSVQRTSNDTLYYFNHNALNTGNLIVKKRHFVLSRKNGILEYKCEIVRESKDKFSW